MGLRSLLIGSAGVAALMAVGGTASAQSAAQAQTGEGIAPGVAAPTQQPSTEMGTVIVTGIRQSYQQALDIKRNSDTIVDVVSAADVGKLPDKNVADALQRVPGVNTVSAASGEGGFDENDRVSIRGTSPSLTQTLVDGHSIANGDWFILDQFSTVGRSVSYTLLPSELVNNVVVYKSQEADLVEGGVAGSVDILTRKPLDFHQNFTVEGQAQDAYAENPHTNEPWLNGLASWKNDAGTFGVLVQGFYEKRDTLREGQEVLGYGTVGPTDATGKAVPALVGAEYPTLIGAALFRQQREREGGNITAQWKPTDNLEFSVNGFYSKLNADNYNSNYLAFLSNEIPNNVPSSYTLKNGTISSASFPLIGPAGTPVNGVVVDNIERPGASGQTYYANLDGKWRPDGRWTITGKGGYTRGEGDTPQQPAYETEAATGTNYSLGQQATVGFPNINVSDPSTLANDWAWNDKATAIDQETYVQGDAEYRIDDGPFEAVKFGFRWADHKRDVTVYDEGTGALGNTTLANFFGGLYPSNFGSNFSNAGFPSGLPLGSASAIISGVSAAAPAVIAGDGGPNSQPYFYWPGSFGVHETDTAGYVMAKLGGDRWHGNVGVRIVDTDEHIKTYVSGSTYTASVYGDYDIDNISHNYLDFLPSATFSFDVTHDFILRASAAETMTRPDYSALGGAVSLTDLNRTGNGGNPDLKPIKAAVYQASGEWYFGPQSLVSLALFDMELQSYVNYGMAPGQYYDQLTHNIQTYQITSPINSSGHSRGFEFNYQQPLLYGFGFIGNLTYAQGGDDTVGGPLVGDSKYTFNLQGYYENKFVSARLAYTYRSAFLVGLDRSSAENQDATGTLDASIDFNVTSHIALTFDALNLTDDLLRYYAANRDQPRAVYDNGRQFYAGVRFKY